MEYLFKSLARLVYKIAEEQTKIEVFNFADYYYMVCGSTWGGTKLSEVFQNLRSYTETEETKRELKELQEKFKESVLMDYRLFDVDVNRRKDDWERAFSLELFQLLTFQHIMTFPEAEKRWNLGTSTLRKAARSGRFLENEVRKSEKTWLVTRSGMERLYGKEPKKLLKKFKK